MDNLTPAQEKKAADFLGMYDGDWGVYSTILMEQRSLSREAAMLTMLAMQMVRLANVIEKQTHPDFREDCEHCQRQRRALELQEKLLQLGEDELKGDQWNDSEREP